MGDYNLLQDFVNNVSQEWFKKFFIDKLDLLKNGLLEAQQDFIGDFIPDVNVTNQLLANIKKQVSELKTHDQIDNFIKKNSLQLKVDGGFNSEIQSELLNTIKENPTNIQEKITELIIKMQIGNIVKSGSKALEINAILLNKLGNDTSFSEIDREDITYILDTEISKSVEKLKNWSSQNPEQAENYEEELKILLSSDNSEKKEEACEIIEHYFETIIGNEIEEEDLQKLNPDDMDEKSKVIIFNDGVMIAEEVSAKIRLSSIFKKILNNKKTS
ncbi:hypothetical protein SGLAD_v1c04850 [Spiroplasma gladiatoris]|uniref:Uncharacterized protein n=1 Tax=Spiroplasma gladiatoris TaxID=2143 RepID=A0A4P7AGY0_9MOLU|nr:hypothetical protein [Spiroplasma gladiatoris]QBQ07684.1 hypothetical protein SGLAD_v1c04850 [Spiroplasma gladiatoris]